MHYRLDGIILNYIGATFRWIYGSIWRTLFRKPKFTFSEYLNGQKKSDYYDEMGHQLNNKLIGMLGLFLIIIPIIQLIFG